MLHQLTLALIALQSETIGLFRPHYPNQPLELVVQYDKEGAYVKTIHIGELGGLQETNCPIEKGTFKLFPDGKSLSQMMDNPFELDEFCKGFGK